METKVKLIVDKWEATGFLIGLPKNRSAELALIFEEGEKWLLTNEIDNEIIKIIKIAIKPFIRRVYMLLYETGDIKLFDNDVIFNTITGSYVRLYDYLKTEVPLIDYEAEVVNLIAYNTVEVLKTQVY